MHFHAKTQNQIGPHLQHRALIKVVCTGPSLQGGERHVPPGEGGDVAELVRAQSRPLVISRADVGLGVLPVGLPTGGAVKLVRHPGATFCRALVDGEALRTTGVEFQSHVGYLESLPCGE